MQDKTIAFIGDSLGRQQFQSLMCMASGGEESPEVENVGKNMVLSKLVEPFVLMAGLIDSQTQIPPFCITGQQV